MEANKEQLFNKIIRNFAFIENLLLYEDVLETHIRTLIELARLLEDTSLRLRDAFNKKKVHMEGNCPSFFLPPPSFKTREMKRKEIF